MLLNFTRNKQIVAHRKKLLKMKSTCSLVTIIRFSGKLLSPRWLAFSISRYLSSPSILEIVFIVPSTSVDSNAAVAIFDVSRLGVQQVLRFLNGNEYGGFIILQDILNLNVAFPIQPFGMIIQIILFIFLRFFCSSNFIYKPIQIYFKF